MVHYSSEQFGHSERKFSVFPVMKLQYKQHRAKLHVVVWKLLFIHMITICTHVHVLGVKQVFF